MTQDQFHIFMIIIFIVSVFVAIYKTYKEDK